MKRSSEPQGALVYYYDHQEELDQEIDKGLREAARIPASLGTSPIDFSREQDRAKVGDL